MLLAGNQEAVPFIVEKDAYEGVKRIASKVMGDVERVSGSRPELADGITGKNMVLCGTAGYSPLIDLLEEQGKLDLSGIRGKREVYIIKVVEHPFEGVEQGLIICGSDKRGTIYGMFALSEYIGVTPLHFWGDAEPVTREQILIGKDIEAVSKEPSVRYRGFFINDEWPCFGNWTFGHFGGFTAEMYDHVFELLLRLKGNYLWPAMWTSCFPLDGPGSLNAELADVYGVVMGSSHHEPCLRASEEWDLVRGEDSPYGNEWNYETNRDGLIRYWSDGLIRSGKYENMITLGMRGERDTSMLEKGAGLSENIEILKDIITVQRQLIKEHVSAHREEVPLLLALYKEVEAYFYGDENTPGLKAWEGLDGVICMLCEDNFGHMRTLPSPELRERRGRFGMYYHFDYHGGPVSYEWMPSTPFAKTWEQMCMAYDYGIRDVWIVNVGDLKGNEVSLSYFMELAYDYDAWGSSAPGSFKEFVARWLKRTFPQQTDAVWEKMAEVLVQFIDINGMRRPEALHEGIYHPCHYLETDRMLERASRIQRLVEEIGRELKAAERLAYYSMISYPAMASVTLLRMHLYAGKNAHYAKQGRVIANRYAELVTECIEKDRQLAAEFGAFREGKWKGMELAQHIGFTKWNEDDCRYPIRRIVEPVHKPQMSVSRKDSGETAGKRYGAPMRIRVDDFLYEGRNEVILEIANTGIGEVEYVIDISGGVRGEEGCQWEWLKVTPGKGRVALLQEVRLSCDRSRLPRQRQEVCLFIRDGETVVEVMVAGRAVETDGKVCGVKLPPMTFLAVDGVFAAQAHHYAIKKQTDRGRFVELAGYGRSGYGMKVFPVTESFAKNEEKPTLTYRFYTEKPGEYVVEVWTAPANPAIPGRSLQLQLTHNQEPTLYLTVVEADYQAGSSSYAGWNESVLDNVRITRGRILAQQGVQELTIGVLHTELVLERILLYHVEASLKPSYLGPEESYYIPE